MSPCNKQQQLLGPAMPVRRPIFILAFCALVSGLLACSGQNSPPGPFPLWLFDDHPVQMVCADRPTPPPPGVHAWVSVSPQAPYARTRLETLDLPRYQVPALTIAAESINDVRIQGANRDHWTLSFCAMGQGNTVEEANGYMQKISMVRTGSLLTLNDADSRGLTGGQAHLLVTAPAEAPVTVHSDDAVEVHDMAGPVRILAARGRATILNTSGLVDASAMIVDFGGSQGSVTLNASWDIEIKLTGTEFRGNLRAYAQRQVRAVFPPGFQTPMVVIVNRPKDFVCRADFCSKIKKGREHSLYRFTYGNIANASDRIDVRSESAQVTLDTAQ